MDLTVVTRTDSIKKDCRSCSKISVDRGSGFYSQFTCNKQVRWDFQDNIKICPFLNLDEMISHLLNVSLNMLCGQQITWALNMLTVQHTGRQNMYFCFIFEDYMQQRIYLPAGRVQKYFRKLGTVSTTNNHKGFVALFNFN